jgi:hypothetical protein
MAGPGLWMSCLGACSSVDKDAFFAVWETGFRGTKVDLGKEYGARLGHTQIQAAVKVGWECAALETGDEVLFMRTRMRLIVFAAAGCPKTEWRVSLGTKLCHWPPGLSCPELVSPAQPSAGELLSLLLHHY